MSGKTPTIELISRYYGLSARPIGTEWTLEESYEYCKKLTYSHYENFPVGSLLVPAKLRPHVHAIYAFSRVADDFSDEEEYEGRRLDFLDAWEQELLHCYRGMARNPIFIALENTATEYELPIDLFQGLLRAFKQDVTVKRYAGLGSVIQDYCQYSANPVGRLILHLFEYKDEELFLQSDAICTALQLTNFWQDVAIDLKKDRVYIPQDLMAAEGYSEEELFAHTYDARYLRIMDQLAYRTWELFDKGYPLVESVRWPLSAELRFTWMGGTTVLERTKRNRYDVFNHRPKLYKFDFIGLGLRSLLGMRKRRERLRNYFDRPLSVSE